MECVEISHEKKEKYLEMVKECREMIKQRRIGTVHALK